MRFGVAARQKDGKEAGIRGGDRANVTKALKNQAFVGSPKKSAISRVLFGAPDPIVLKIDKTFPKII